MNDKVKSTIKTNDKNFVPNKSKIVVLAEKPSVGRDIARVLNCTKKINGGIEGNKYIVTWALGHLVTLATPEKHDKKYEKWSLETLPMLPEKLKLEVIQKTSKQYNAVKTLLVRKDVTEIIIATDAGREGELVARWIIEKAKVHKPIKRLWISSVTDKAIREGFNNLKPGRNYENLYQSAVARSEADWIVGMNGTRALTCKYNAQLSCGRVQTPTLAIVQYRQDEISRFEPKKYYGIQGSSNGLKLTWKDLRTNDSHSFNKEKIETIIDSIKDKDGLIISLDAKKKKSHSPGLYNLTELQKDADKLFDYTAKETLSIMQKLYEQHKVLTYPRTDSRFLSEDIVETLKDRLTACGIGPMKKLAFRLSKSTIRGNKSFVDNKKVTDHHAIIPTEEGVIPSELSNRERNIYDLVVERFLAVLSPAYEYEEIIATIKIGKELLTVKDSRTINLGWKAIANENAGQSGNSLDHLAKGQKLKIDKMKMTEGVTSPPPLFTEGTLLGAMENPKKYMENQNKELLQTIGESGGLGTVATRADIMEKLLGNHLIEKNGKHLRITSKGRQLLKLVPSDLKTPTLTAKWEQNLTSIANGKLDKNQFLRDMRKYTKEIVKEIKESEASFKHDNMTRTECPECGKYLLEVKTKNGKSLVCQDRECGYRKGLSRVTNSRCPNCHKKLELRGSGESQIFVCKCGHKEKMSSFTKRKEESKKVMSKSEVRKYLDSENKKEEGNFNNPFAAALANLTVDKKK